MTGVQTCALPISIPNNLRSLPLTNGNDLKLLGIEQSSRYQKLLDWAYDLQLRGHNKESILKMIKGR